MTISGTIKDRVTGGHIKMSVPSHRALLEKCIKEQKVSLSSPMPASSQMRKNTEAPPDFRLSRIAEVGVILPPRHHRRTPIADGYATTTGRVHDGRTVLYRAAQHHCDACPMKRLCCPNTPHRRIPRDIHEGSRDLARELAKTDAYYTSRRQRKKVEMLFAHLKRILRLGRLRLRGPTGARDEFLLAATAQNLRKMAKLILMPQPASA